MRNRYRLLLFVVTICATILAVFARQTPTLMSQTSGEAAQKSAGCISAGCHVNAEPMHVSEAVRLGCTDCHGGNARAKEKREAHPSPLNPELFRTTANPVRAYTEWLRENA